jgi:hypothetical protein
MVVLRNKLEIEFHQDFLVDQAAILHRLRHLIKSRTILITIISPVPLRKWSDDHQFYSVIFKIFCLINLMTTLSKHESYLLINKGIQQINMTDKF